MEGDEEFSDIELVGGGSNAPNSRVAKLEEEAFLESLKQYKHVQPRIDPDNYQAELPEMITPENQPPDHDFGELTRYATVNWYNSTRCTHNTERHAVIEAWLCMVRNIFEPFKYKDSSHWTQNTARVPLESDAKAISFLASNDYNIDRAQFNLFCHLGMGKDLSYVKRTSDLIAKQPVAAIYSEMKEKLFRSGATKPMLGAYEKPIEKDTGSNSNSNSSSSAPKDPTVLSSSSSKQAAKEAKEQARLEKEERESKNKTSANVHTNYFDSAFPLSYAKSKGKDSKGDSLLSSGGGMDLEDEKNSDDMNRSAPNRGQKDKSETKKRWMHILKESCALLQRKAENASEKPASGIRKANRGTTAAAESLLDEVAVLGPFYDSPGDDFAEHLRVILGELIKQNQSSREWVAELRDLMQPRNCYHGPRHKRNYPRLKEMRDHLKKSDSLQLLPPEESNLRAVIADIQEMNASAKQLFSHLKIGAEGEGDRGEDEGEMPDLPNILDSIANNKMVAPTSQSVDWIPTMEDVSNVLNAAQHMHIDIPVRTFLSALWDKANELIYEVGYFLDRAQACRVRTKVRSIGASGKKHTLADARQLQKKVLDFPLDIGLLAHLDNIIDTGEAWQKEVHAIANQGQDRGKSQRQREKERDGDSNKAGSASIKRVETLISEGEKSVFNFEKELDILKERRSQAKQWLDRLKNSFRPKSKHNARSKTEIGEDGQPIKMALSDMRSMVQEGADLLEDESKQSATARELGKAQSVVDIAEEWLSRVREALALGGSNQDISELQELIGESDDMPVYMEEAVVLRSHFSAMEWAKKARKVLYEEPPGYKLIEHAKMKDAAAAAARAARVSRRQDERRQGGIVDADADADGAAMDEEADIKEEPIDRGEESEEAMYAREEAEKAERKLLEEERIFAYPRLSDVQKIYAQIIKIRDQVPKHISAEFSLKPLVEESDTIEIIERAEAWIIASKKLMVSGNVKKGSKLKKLREMYLEAADFKINFVAELKPFRIAIVAAENWIASYSDVISRLNIDVNLERTVELEEGDDGYEEFGIFTSESVASTDTADINVATNSTSSAIIINSNSSMRVEIDSKDNDKQEPEEQVTYNLLQRCVIAGDPLVCEFAELDESRIRLMDTDLWILRMKEMCSKSGEEILVQKRIKGPETDNKSGGSHKKKDKKGDGRVRRADLVQLLHEAEFLKLNLYREKEVVQKCIATSDIFDQKVQVAMENEIKGKTLEIMLDLKNVLQTQPESLAAAFEHMFPSSSSSSSSILISEFNPHEYDPTEEEDVDEHDQALMPVLYDFISTTRTNSEKKATAAKNAAEVDPIATSLNELMETIDTLQGEALQIGVSTPITVTLDVYMNALEWIEDVRELLYPTEEKKTARGNLSTKVDPTSLLMPEWGNLKQETLVAYIQDASIAVPFKVRTTFSSLYEGSMMEEIITSIDGAEDGVHAQRQTLSTSEVSAFQKLVSLCMPAGQRRAKKEKEDTAKMLAAAEGADTVPGDADEDEEPEAIEVVEAPKQRVSRKRKSKDKPVVEPDVPVPASKGGKRGRKSKDEIKVEEVVNAIDANQEEIVEADVVIPEQSESETEEGDGFKSKFSKFRKEIIAAEKNSEVGTDLLIPESLQKVVDFYMRCLGLALQRTCEVDQWRRSSNAVLQRSLTGTSSGVKRCVNDVFYLLRYSDHRGYYLKERTLLENEALKVQTWTNLAAQMKQRQNMLHPDELKTWVRDGERMIFDHPSIRDMKDEHRKAKLWVGKLHATGIEKGLAKTTDLQDLLPEVEEICSDLSTFTESIYATTKSYCLCRQAYFGLMVGCDSCDDWFHAPCIGLSKAQAERTDAFICFRCNIVDSFRLAAASAGSIANKWMLKADVVNKRENDKQRILKKIQNEERQLERIQNALDMHINFMTKQQQDARANAPVLLQPTLTGLLSQGHGGTDSHSSSHIMQLESGGGDTVDATATATVTATDAISIPEKTALEKVLGAADPNQIKRYDVLQLEFRETSKRLAEAQRESDNNDLQTNMEQEKAPLMIAWMQQVQTIIWPANKAEETAGIPKGDELPFVKLSEQGSDYVDSLAKLLSHTLSAPLLSKQMCALANQAISDSLDKADDILTVVETFRWMSWCSILLRLLRHPPTTVLIKKMCDVAKTISVQDERIVRFMQNIVIRSQIWKTKARKMLYYNTPSQPYMTNKRVDTIRANNLLLEGNQIPITSRIKDVLRIQLKNVARAETPQIEQLENEDDSMDDGKRSRVQSKKIEPQLTVNTPQITHITFTGELPDSSDEDISKPGTASYSQAVYAQYCARNGGNAEGAPAVKRTLAHFPTPIHTLSENKQLWPVLLSQGRKSLVPWNDEKEKDDYSSGNGSNGKRSVGVAGVASNEDVHGPAAPSQKKNRAS